MNLKKTRWQQRFQNLKKIYQLFQETAQIKNPSKAERAGLVQFFEITFELSWKTLKDYLESEGFIVKSPRETLKQAIQIEVLENNEIWAEILDDRNLTSHLYSEEICFEIEERIQKKYIKEIEKLYKFFKEKENAE